MAAVRRRGQQRFRRAPVINVFLLRGVFGGGLGGGSSRRCCFRSGPSGGDLLVPINAAFVHGGAAAITWDFFSTSSTLSSGQLKFVIGFSRMKKE
ncbi:predicted protein [Arabidopsis lyrata subsp. lyrata]|uniref:Predicted protein n=1 Tax=Arabidopsis lyrata subsp. lyrata TaxID=81972 RepID=D7KIR9_ARALL|nr:predicted protein [Arabidopsis lyrata subsp. lyrata]